MLENDSTLTPTYHPGNEDIANRMVVLELHARGKDPIEDIIVSDTMLVSIIHNASADVKIVRYGMCKFFVPDQGYYLQGCKYNILEFFRGWVF